MYAQSEFYVLKLWIIIRSWTCSGTNIIKLIFLVLNVKHSQSGYLCLRKLLRKTVIHPCYGSYAIQFMCIV